MDFSVVGEFKLLLWQGFLRTVELSALSIAAGTALGFVTCLAKTSRLKWLSIPASIYIEIFRGSPLLMQLFMFYFGLPYLGLTMANSNPGLALVLQNLPQFSLTVVVLTLYSGAYIAEIFRSGWQSIHRGQFEAASALGFGYFSTIRKVILPQMMKIAYPPLVGFYIGLIKDTSLASIIGFQELVKQGQSIINTTSRPFEVYLAISAIYFLICYPLSRLVTQAERRQPT